MAKSAAALDRGDTGVASSALCLHASGWVTDAQQSDLRNVQLQAQLCSGKDSAQLAPESPGSRPPAVRAVQKAAVLQSNTQGERRAGVRSRSGRAITRRRYSVRIKMPRDPVKLPRSQDGGLWVRNTRPQKKRLSSLPRKPCFRLASKRNQQVEDVALAGILGHCTSSRGRNRTAAQRRCRDALEVPVDRM